MTYTDPPKAICAMRYWLHGKEFYTALKALEFASKYHTGVRKDGKTPEFHHQMSVALFVRTLEKGLLFPQETLSTAILHDVVEDYNVSLSDIQTKFGAMTAEAVAALSKQIDGFKKSDRDYYNQIAHNPIASIVKGADRINNIQTMLGVFTADKQFSYIAESESLVTPMLKTARRLFPEQEASYENIKNMLVAQISILKGLLRST